VSISTIVIIVLAVTSAVMAIFCMMVLLFFKDRLTSLEREIKETKAELAKANVSLATMVHYIENREPRMIGNAAKEDSRLASPRPEPVIFPEFKLPPGSLTPQNTASVKSSAVTATVELPKGTAPMVPVPDLKLRRKQS
jgi:hypothetical protein